MPIYRGLNINKGMIDVDDPIEALRNIGLNIDDLDLITGLASADVDIKDFHSMANLTDDQEKVFGAMMTTGELTGELTDELPDIAVPMNFNIFMNSQLAGSAIKYNYLDFSTTETIGFLKWKQEKADISTSRISSWSPIGPEATPDSKIFYGGEVKSLGAVSYTSLKTDIAPLEKTFRAEVPTHILKIKIDGVEQQLLAMKGIPLIFDGAFRDCDLTASVIGIQDSSGSTIPITWRITNLDPTATVYSSGDGSNGTGSVGIGTLNSPTIYSFRDSQSRPRRIEFFYNPSKIEHFKVTGSNISAWTNVSLPALKKLDLSSNDLAVIPSFRDDTTASSVAKNGMAVAKGLAPILEELTLTGNNLSRASLFLQGSDEISDNITYSTANALLNRLPLTMKKIFVNGCFSDSTLVDLTDYTALEEFSMGTQYSGDLTRAMTGGIVYPQVVDTTKANTGFNNWDTYNYSTTKIIIDSAVAFKLYDGTPSANALATVKYLNGAYDNAGTIELPTNYPTGVINGGLVPNTVYTLKAEGAGNRYEVFLGATQLSALVSGTGEPGAHCFKACDASGNILYDDTIGIKKYTIDHQSSYNRLPIGITSSSKLLELNLQNTRLVCNAERPHTSSASTAIMTAISAERAVTIRSTDLVKFSSTNNRSSLGGHNVINMSGKSNLTEYTHQRHSIKNSYRRAEKTVDGKFDDCTSLYRFDVLGTNAMGDWGTNAMFNNKPDLDYIDIRYTWLDGRLNDSTFGSNTKKIRNIYIAGWSYGNSSNDILGIDGSTGHTGQSLTQLSSLSKLYVYNTDRACIRFVDGDNSLNLDNNLELTVLYCADGGLTGKLPEFTNNQKLYYFSGARNKSTLNARWAQPGVRHTIISFYDPSNQSNRSNNTVQMWKDIGWTNVNAFTGEAQGASGGTVPAVGDAFIATSVPVATVPLVQNKRYRIFDVGTTSLSDWNSITGQNKTDINQYRYPYDTSYANFSFNAPSPPDLSSIDGTGTVRPDGYDKVVTAGLDETLPEWNLAKMQYIYLQNNSIPGQFPKMTLPVCKRIWANNNLLTGSIPDFSDCPVIDNIRLQNNKLSEYVSGTLSLNKYITTLNLRNNNLPASSATSLISDLYANYLLRKRGGVVIDLLGQTVTSGDSLGLSAIIDDDSSGDLSSANKLAALRNAGWSILLDA